MIWKNIKFWFNLLRPSYYKMCWSLSKNGVFVDEYIGTNSTNSTNSKSIGVEDSKWGFGGVHWSWWSWWSSYRNIHPLDTKRKGKSTRFSFNFKVGESKVITQIVPDKAPKCLSFTKWSYLVQNGLNWKIVRVLCFCELFNVWKTKSLYFFHFRSFWLRYVYFVRDKRFKNRKILTCSIRFQHSSTW